MQFNVALIGCGGMGGLHAKAWQAREDASLTAVFDPNAETARAVADETGAVVYGSFEEAIQADDVNVVDVCTPVCFHTEIACFAAENGRTTPRPQQSEPSSWRRTSMEPSWLWGSTCTGWRRTTSPLWNGSAGLPAR